MKQQRSKLGMKSRESLRLNMQPVFRFADGLFVLKLTPELRKVLKVEEDNPGVVVIVE